MISLPSAPPPLAPPPPPHTRVVQADLLEVWGGLELDALTRIVRVRLPSVRHTCDLLYTVPPWIGCGSAEADPAREVGAGGGWLCRIIRVRLARDGADDDEGDSVSVGSGSGRRSRSSKSHDMLDTLPPPPMCVGSIALFGTRLPRSAAAATPGRGQAAVTAARLSTAEKAAAAVDLLMSPRSGGSRRSSGDAARRAVAAVGGATRLLDDPTLPSSLLLPLSLSSHTAPRTHTTFAHASHHDITHSPTQE